MQDNPTYGNYKGYYANRPFVNDPRLALLPPNFFREAVVLDIGCNEGRVTCQIAQQHGANHVVGVDIDPDLIRTAWRRRRTAWSLQEPESDFYHNDGRSFEPSQRNKHTAKGQYFPQAMEHMFGPVAIGESTPEDQTEFPHNLTFRTADWVKDGILDDEHGYDIILAFSISKWIHLNEGDEGLKQFFKKVFKFLRPGGKFLLEPQAWENYRKAKRLDSTMKEVGSTLQIRPDDFPEMLKEIGFATYERLGTTREGGTCR
ncbi:hypothetical protein M422DRAFT_194134 [Sphaerobolus stellatus SS14]|uniref:RNA methyltransferase n=1 Tax=Sphaerobolus stellatus (strain SS14) TaxID=990650 RepID=A0A0C9U785_SPHS4|nr:hypothetical protein M422DRAFT_194134 [Sphaerobolus stellatus SS14]